MLLDRCEFGRTDYNLNIVHPPVYEDEEEETDPILFRRLPLGKSERIQAVAVFVYSVKTSFS